jgi:hypothetical protein
MGCGSPVMNALGVLTVQRPWYKHQNLLTINPNLGGWGRI